MCDDNFHPVVVRRVPSSSIRGQASSQEASYAKGVLLAPGLDSSTAAWQRGLMTQCRLRRSRFYFSTPGYQISLEKHSDVVLASTQKSANKKKVIYKVVSGSAAAASHGVDVLGKVKSSDSSATEYVMYGPGLNPHKMSVWHEDRDALDQGQAVRTSIASISYSKRVARTHLLGLRARGHGPRTLSCEVLDLGTEGTTYSLRSKQPVWDEVSDAFGLNFRGRASSRSSKNFQLYMEGDPKESVIMQFGKVKRNEFTLDYRWPLTGLQAFGIALSAFDQRLA